MHRTSFVQVTLPLLLLAGACSSPDETTGPDAGPVDSGEVPDNCTAMQACILVAGQRASDHIAPVVDEDPWTFQVPSAGQVIHILVENDADFSPVRLEVALFGPDGMVLENPRYQGTGKQKIEIQRVAVAAGTYKLEVRDVGGDGADRRNPYFVTLSLLSETDMNESNDTAETATPLGAGVASSGTIGFQGDEDWFSIDVGANQLVQVQMSAPGTSQVKLRWSLYDPSGTTRIAQSDEPAAGATWPTENRAVGNAAGRYLIKVEDSDEDGPHADLDRLYVLTAGVVGEPDVQEQASPNETFQTATAITSGQSVSGFIAATSDVDYYAIIVAQAPQVIQVQASMPGASDVDLAFVVLDSDGDTLICDARDGDLCKAFRFVRDGAAGPANLVTAHVAETPGTYFVKVSDQQDNDFDTSVPYTVTVTLPAEPDANENYNLDGRAGSVVVAPSSFMGSTLQFPWVEGFISHADDEDWFRFDLPGTETLDPAQNGDWLVHVELQMSAPTPVELQAFFYGPENSSRERYRGYGKRCRDPSPDDPMNCQFPDADNQVDLAAGETAATIGQGECFVVFREVTTVGPHYFRMTDLDRDDFDIGGSGRYRLRVTATAGCPATSVCSGIFTQGGMDLCGRP